MLINELAQWATLVFLAIFVLGLTRQLGNFLVPPRDRAALEVGPDLGKTLPTGLLSDQDRRRLYEAMDQRGLGWAVFLVVGEECDGCKGLLEGLAEHGAPDEVAVVAVSSEAGPEYRRLLDSLADLVIVDADRVKAAELAATPFAVIVDRSLKVVHKQLAWDLAEVVEVWRRQDGAEDEGPSRRAQSAEELEIVQNGGRR